MSLEELDKVLCIAVHDAVMKFNQQVCTVIQSIYILNFLSFLFLHIPFCFIFLLWF